MMPPPRPPPDPPSYDDLVRGVVPLPDSSHRPLRAEEEAAATRPPGPRITEAFTVGTARAAAVRAALLRLDGADLSDLDVQLDDGRVTLAGSVGRHDDRDRVVRAMEALDGIIAVIDALRIRTT